MNAISVAAPGCEACHETGKVHGFGHADGKVCPCVAHCYSCGLAFAWSHDDERAPFECDDCVTDEDTPTIPRIRIGGAT